MCGRYEGEFRKGLKRGKGMFIGEDGSIYEGDFENDCRKGFGTLTYPDKRVYTGEFKENKPNGDGAVQNITGSILEGKWTNGMYSGNNQLASSLFSSHHYSEYQINN